MEPSIAEKIQKMTSESKHLARITFVDSLCTFGKDHDFSFFAQGYLKVHAVMFYLHDGRMMVQICQGDPRIFDDVRSRYVDDMPYLVLACDAERLLKRYAELSDALGHPVIYEPVVYSELKELRDKLSEPLKQYKPPI